METNSEIKQLSYNKPQKSFFLNLWRGNIKKAHNVWGRATGKSTVIALLIDMIVRTMPRSTWSIQGSTFQQLLTLTLPGTMEGLESLGYQRDVHYFIGKKPPKGYELPYWTPFKFDNFITFLRPDGNSVGFALLSQDREGGGRGPSFDGVICDESLTLDHEKFSKETKATNRGHDQYFGQHHLHHGIFHFTSMPYGSAGKWLTEPGSYYEESGYNYQLLRNKIIELQIDFITEQSNTQRLNIFKDIEELSRKIRSYPSDKGFYYSEANSFDNIKNLGLRYILDLHEGLPETIFLIEVMNKHLRKIQDAFYPTLDRNIHGYKGEWNYSYLDNLDFDFTKIQSLDSRQDKDCNENLPLHLGMDFGAAINWIVVAQKYDSINRVNFIKNFYVKSPKILDHVCEAFCDYYRFHKRKEIYFYPDPAGNNRRDNSDVTPVQQAMAIFKKHGWTVRLVTVAKKNIPHNDKYLLWANALLNKDKLYPAIGFNVVNCKELLVSMEQAPAIDDGNKGIRKNKSSERKLKDKREEATDASDAADLLLWGMYRHLLVYTKRLPFITNL